MSHLPSAQPALPMRAPRIEYDPRDMGLRHDTSGQFPRVFFGSGEVARSAYFALSVHSTSVGQSGAAKIRTFHGILCETCKRAHERDHFFIPRFFQLMVMGDRQDELREWVKESGLLVITPRSCRPAVIAAGECELGKASQEMVSSFNLSQVKKMRESACEIRNFLPSEFCCQVQSELTHSLNTHFSTTFFLECTQL